MQTKNQNYVPRVQPRDVFVSDMVLTCFRFPGCSSTSEVPSGSSRKDLSSSPTCAPHWSPLVLQQIEKCLQPRRITSLRRLKPTPFVGTPLPAAHILRPESQEQLLLSQTGLRSKVSTDSHSSSNPSKPLAVTRKELANREPNLRVAEPNTPRPELTHVPSPRIGRADTGGGRTGAR